MQITFFGDIYLQKKVSINLKHYMNPIVNLEGPITNSSKGYPGKINLKMMKYNFISSFTRYPIAVNLANNHIMDYGVIGFNDTINILNDLNIKYFGAGFQNNNCNNPLILDVDSKRIALMGYVSTDISAILAEDDQPGCRPIVLENIIKDIDEVRNDNIDRIIIVLHWGKTQVHLPKPNDVEIARKIIDYGADLIIGHHSHCIQSYESYKGKYIFYGLGNCVFTDHESCSYYNQDGKYTKIVKSKQRNWNKKSLAVAYDIQNENVIVDELFFDNNKLIRNNISSNKYYSDSLLNKKYSIKYKRAIQKSKIRRAASNFIISPDLKKIKNLSSIYKRIKRV